MTSETKVEGNYFWKGAFKPVKEYEDDIKVLQDWLITQQHLPTLSDEHLHLFLHSCEQNVSLTKTTIESYFSLRTHSPELFRNINPLSAEFQNVLNIAQLCPLTKTTKEGYKVILYRLSDYDAAKYNFVPALRVFFAFNDVRLAEDGLVPGYIVIFDMKGVNLTHLAKATLSALKKFMNYIQDCHPARLKGIHVINTVSFIEKVLAVLKPFMKNEIMKILHFHGSAESLEKYLPLEILPEDCGGKSESSAAYQEKTKALLEKQSTIDWFQEHEKLKVDESKRKGKKHQEAESYGAEGSFRKLAID